MEEHEYKDGVNTRISADGKLIKLNFNKSVTWVGFDAAKCIILIESLQACLERMPPERPVLRLIKGGGNAKMEPTNNGSRSEFSMLHFYLASTNRYRKLKENKLMRTLDRLITRILYFTGVLKNKR